MARATSSFPVPLSPVTITVEVPFAALRMVSNTSSISRRMLEVFDTIRKAANGTSTVMVTGESGTGKELVALAIHHEGGRRHGPFVSVNCGAIPEGLMESELFGHLKGAFTGAVANTQGLFASAEGGTLFLDE